ncbi:MAG: AraC family transcriptional regulator [Acidobacteriota bacterium]|nr:AraC family transcriptional regulator [Acidobacteriota bacterium]
MSDCADEEIQLHTHEDAHFLLVVEGVYITSARNIADFCPASTLIFNPAGTTHRDRFQTRGGRFFTVSLEPESLARLQDGINLITHSIGFPDSEVLWLGSRLYRELQTMDGASPLIMEGMALELLGYTMRRQTERGKLPPPSLKLAYELIHDRFAESLTIGEIAHIVGVHPVYLVRVFRKHYRMTIGEYQRKLRIEFACRQISATDAPLSDIAIATGFYDQSHFYRTFKQFVGMTPTEYRNIFRF